MSSSQTTPVPLKSSTASVEATPPSVRASTGTSNTGSTRHLHHEDVLLRTWRSIAHSTANVTNKAEKAVGDVSSRELLKDLNEATVGFLRIHMEWGRSISYLEAKLEGKASEMEALQHFVRSQPSLGRKRKLVGEDSDKAEKQKASSA